MPLRGIDMDCSAVFRALPFHAAPAMVISGPSRRGMLDAA